MRRIAAALLLASLLIAEITTAVCAHAQTAVAFQPVELEQPPRRSHWVGTATLVTGLVLISASFPLASAADRRYEEYLTETEPGTIEDRFQGVIRADRLAAVSLVSGEVLLATGVWLRFIRRAPESRLSLAASADRCAVTLRF